MGSSEPDHASRLLAAAAEALARLGPLADGPVAVTARCGRQALRVEGEPGVCGPDDRPGG